MTLPRVIPCLLLRGEGLYKSRRFGDWRYVGDPRNAIRIFNEKEVDEIFLLDVEASRNSRPPPFALIEECAGECFMPLGYGGGVRTAETAAKLVSLGVEKVVLNAAALDRPSLIREVADRIGSCSTVVCIDVKRSFRGKARVYEHRAGKRSRVLPVEWARRAVSLGAGEIVLQDVDRDGMLSGPDVGLLRAVTDEVDVPVTVLGGVASLDHCTEAWRAGASGVAAGSWFVFQQPHRAVLITYPRYPQIRAAFGRAHRP